MKHKTQQHWQDLIKQQADSHLSVLEFCKQHQISTSHFYKHKAANKVASRSQKNAFVKAERTQSSIPKQETITLQLGQAQLYFPLNIQPSWLADFVRALG